MEDPIEKEETQEETQEEKTAQTEEPKQTSETSDDWDAKVNVDDIEDAEAHKIIMNHILWAMGMGLIPLPLIDVAAVTAVQLDMLKQLADHYGVDFSKSSGKMFISSLAGSTLAAIGAGLVKAIPGIGSIIGGISQAVLSGATTYAIGQVAVRHFYDGGDFLNFQADDFTDYYKEMFHQGKSVAEDLRSKKKDKHASGETVNRRAKTQSTEPTKDIVDRIKDLAKLHEKGILSDDEFTQMKAKLIQDF